MATVLSIFSWLTLPKGCCLAFVLALALPVPASDAAHVAGSLLLFLLLGGDTAHRQEPCTGTTRSGVGSTEVIVLQEEWAG